jgi:hypothetical protein
MRDQNAAAALHKETLAGTVERAGYFGSSFRSGTFAARASPGAAISAAYGEISLSAAVRR